MALGFAKNATMTAILNCRAKTAKISRNRFLILGLNRQSTGHLYGFVFASTSDVSAGWAAHDLHSEGAPVKPETFAHLATEHGIQNIWLHDTPKPRRHGNVRTVALWHWPQHGWSFNTVEFEGDRNVQILELGEFKSLDELAHRFKNWEKQERF